MIRANRPIKGFLHMGDSILTHDTWDRLGEIKTPSLLMGGADDLITTAPHMVEMSKRMPNAECRIIPNTLHGFMVERPDTFAAIVDFLKAH